VKRKASELPKSQGVRSVKAKQERNIFDKYYRKYDAWYDVNKFAYLSELEVMRRVLPPDGKGLEIGVGTGRFAAPLGITTGIDSSPNMVEIAAQRGVDAHVGFGENLPFGNAAFDYVVIVIAICFVKNPQVVLKEAFRVLRKEGSLIVGIIDKDSFLGRYYRKKKSIFYKMANFFSPAEVTELMKKSGFSEFSYYQTLYELPDRMKFVQDPRKGFGKGGFVVISAKKHIGR